MASAGHALCLFSLGLAKSWFHESRTHHGHRRSDVTVIPAICFLLRLTAMPGRGPS